MSKLSAMSTSIVLIIIGIAITTQHAACEPYPWADNVCNRSVPIKKDIVIEQPVQYEIKVQSMCGILPCVKTRIETRQDQSIKTIVIEKERSACCEGYAETPSRQCAPICLDSCNNGKCVAPNICKCQPEPTESSPGFVGPTCRRFTCLARQRWGHNCERECPSQCSQNSYCSADTGKCLCYPGWHGPDCNLECDANSDADDCQESNRMPAIVEPEANLLMPSGNLIIESRSRQAPQALKLDDGDIDDGVKIIAQRPNEGQAWAGFASNYLVGVLSLLSLILLVAFLIVRSRYEVVRNELYYASAASTLSSNSRGGPASGPGSEYSMGSSAYYSTGRQPSVTDGNLEKNLSFATATRNILSGVVGGVAGGKQSATNRDKLAPLIAPRIESHLIKSQKQAEQNIYSELDLANSIANRSRAQTPVRQLSDDHIYSVPKTPPAIADKSKPHDITLEMAHNDDQDEENIYDELKPRHGDSKNIQ